MKLQGIYCEDIKLEEGDPLLIDTRNYLYLALGDIVCKSVNPVKIDNIPRQITVNSVGLVSDWDGEDRKFEWIYYKDISQK